MSASNRLRKIEETIYQGNITGEAHSDFQWLISRVKKLEVALRTIKENPKGTYNQYVDEIAGQALEGGE